MPPLANRVEKFAVTIAANTPQSSATSTDISVQDAYLQRVEITIPDGHNGLTGIQILAAHGQLVPFTAGAFLVSNDRTFTFDMVGAIDTGSFQANCYNGGVFAHTFYILLYMLDFAYVAVSPGPVPVTPTPLLV